MNVLFEDLDSNRLLSPKLWKGFAPPVGGVFPGTASGNPCMGLFDDFNAWGFIGAISSTSAWSQSNGISYLHYIDGDAGLNAVEGIQAAVPSTTPAVDQNGFGVIQIEPDADADDDIVTMAGGGFMVPFNVIPGTAKDLAFETRFKIDDITA